MKNLPLKASALVATVVTAVTVFALAGPAGAQTTTLPPVPNAAGVATAGGASIGVSLVDTVTSLLPYAAALVAVIIGWRLAKRMVRA